MRKLFLLLFLFSLCLFSCAEADGIFDYQDAGGVYEGEISYLQERFSVKITLAPLENGERSAAEIEYLEPESLAGYRVKREGDGYFAVVGDLEIPVTSRSLPQLSFVEELFSLCEADILSIETDGDGNSVVRTSGESSGHEAVAVYSCEGGLMSLSLPACDFTVTFKGK